MMRGQGEPLPSFMKLDGEWIIENHIFLYHSQSNHGTAATFTMGAERVDGSHCVGFDSDQLSAALGINVTTLIEANQNHTLISLGTTDVAPLHGGVSAKAYGFQIGDRNGFLTIEVDQPEGTA